MDPLRAGFPGRCAPCRSARARRHPCAVATRPSRAALYGDVAAPDAPTGPVVAPRETGGHAPRPPCRRALRRCRPRRAPNDEAHLDTEPILSDTDPRARTRRGGSAITAPGDRDTGRGSACPPADSRDRAARQPHAGVRRAPAVAGSRRAGPPVRGQPRAPERPAAPRSAPSRERGGARRSSMKTFACGHASQCDRNGAGSTALVT